MGEPGCTKAYDEDLWWCMVWQRLINGYTIKEIARNSHVTQWLNYHLESCRLF